MGSEPFVGPGPVDGVEGDAQARARRVDPDGSAVVQIVRDRVDRPGRRSESAAGLPAGLPDGSAAGQQEDQGQARAAHYGDGRRGRRRVGSEARRIG